MDNSNSNSCCFVCVEKFNCSTRAQINCEYCDFIACRSCCETYLLSQSTPHCMKSNEECGKIWSRKFISDNFTLKFIKTKYRKHQEQVLFERELALMPETQLLIERRNNRDRKRAQYTAQIIEINDKIDELIAERNDLEQRRNTMMFQNYYGLDGNEDEDEQEQEQENDGQESKEKEKKLKKKFIFRCSNDTCRGFLSSKWKCELCNTWTCSQCRVNVGTNEDKITHVCDKNDLETAKLIRKDSKPCPKCGIIIFKISGCDQMYCTQCNTPFSWSTGNIETGTIHNPHYYEYLRTTGQNVPRNPLDVAFRCERNLTNNFIHQFNFVINDILAVINFRHASNKFEYDTTILNNVDINILHDKILNICQNINHLVYVVLPRLRVDINANDSTREYFRINYLKNSITEDEFKRHIQLIEKNHQKNIEFMNLYSMIRDTVTDIIHMLCDKLKTIMEEIDELEEYELDEVQEYNKIIKTQHEKNLQLITDGFIKHDINKDKIMFELSNLQNYANDCLTNISRTYKCVHKEFDHEFKLTTKGK